MPAKKIPQRELTERRRIGLTIRAIREARGKTVDEIANRVSETAPLGRPFLANIEAGRRGLPQPLAAPLADALGVPLGAIVRDDYYEAGE